MTRPKPAPLPERVVTTQTVQIGDVVVLRDTYRTVRDLRAISGGDRILFFDRGMAYRLRSPDSLPVLRPVSPSPSAPPPAPAAAPVPGAAPGRPAAPLRSMQTAPDRAPSAEPVTYAMQCATCGQTSPPGEDMAPGRMWMVRHPGRYPRHLSYGLITRRPWVVTLTTSPALLR